MTSRRFLAACAALIAILAAVQISSMLGETQTWDEGIHIVAGYSYWRTGDFSFNPEHPPLGKLLAAVPLLALRPSFDTAWLKETPPMAGLYFLYANRLSPEVLLPAARLPGILITLALAAWIAIWTSRNFGHKPALIALALFCFDPNFTAHGRYVTTDVIAAFFIFLAATLWLDCLEQPSHSRALLSGLALGAALTSKYSALFLVPLLILAGFLRRRWRHTGILLLTALAFVLAIYTPEVLRFTGPSKLHDHLVGKGPLGAALVSISSAAPLPYWSYLVGLDRLSEHNTLGHASYLMGQLSEQGWWYYFPVAFLVKTPLATIAAIALTAVLIWRIRERRYLTIGLATVAIVFAAFCLSSKINIGHRHLLPFYPFVFVLAGVVLARYLRVAAVLVALLAVESVSIYPHYLAFFNWAAGGPGNGPKYLLDSNLDWGQDLKHLGAYVRRNRVEKLCLYYFGNGDIVRYAGNFYDLGRGLDNLDCIAAVSATPLHGLYVPRGWNYPFLRLQPIAKVGYSIYVYDMRKKK